MLSVPYPMPPATPIELSLIAPPSEGPTRGRYNRQPSNLGIKLFVVAVGLMLAAAAGIYIYERVTSPTPTPTAARTDPPNVTKATAPVVSPNPKPSTPKTRPAAVPIETPKAPEPPEPLTFDEAYAEALVLSKRLDEAEPEATAAAMKILTGEERARSDIYMGSPLSALLSESAYLASRGLGECLDRFSRKVAADDPAFKATARKLWTPDMRAGGIVRMMNVWGRIDPGILRLIVGAVGADVPTANLIYYERDAILLLGGRKWLER